MISSYSLCRKRKADRCVTESPPDGSLIKFRPFPELAMMSSSRISQKRRGDLYMTKSRSSNEIIAVGGPPTKQRRAGVEIRGESSLEQTFCERDDSFKPLGYKALETACQSSCCIPELFNRAERLKALLTSPEKIRTDLMKLVIRALHQCCLPSDFERCAAVVLNVVKETRFLSEALSRFIQEMPYDQKLRDEIELRRVITQLAEVFLAFLQKFGSEVAYNIPLAQLNESLGALKSNELLRDTSDLEKKIRHVKNLKDEVIRQGSAGATNDHQHEDESNLVPPTNFREMSVVPQAADLSTLCRPFIRHNVTNGRYKDLEHYLDVQFRLLREDFVMPLREGIIQLKKEQESLDVFSTRKTQGTRETLVYHDIVILYPVYSSKGMVYRIRFDALHRRVKRVNWSKARKLLHGALVCLSADDFSSILIATIENRDEKELGFGELDVRFEDVPLEEINHFIQTKQTFAMLESPSFFEAYRHVLEALKGFNKDELLPFQSHIVECQKDVRAPDYVRSSNGWYDMTAILEDECDDLDGEMRLDSYVHSQFFPQDGDFGSEERIVASDEGSAVFDQPAYFCIHDVFPDSHFLGLDQSQMGAFQLALTKRFAVIQGPPGTGKTYVGLKIAQVLLHNTCRQDEEKPSPILMVSFTNHALDQFLEGLLPMEGIVRVGGRSKSDRLKAYTLKQLRLETRDRRDGKKIPSGIRNAKRKVRKKIQEFKEDGVIDMALAVLKSSRRGILSFHVLKQFMSESHVQWFEKALGKNNDDVLCNWLAVVRRPVEKRAKNGNNHATERDEDFRMQFSVCNFAIEEDQDDDDDDDLMNSRNVTSCSIEETERPDELRRNLEDEQIMFQNEVMNVRSLSWLPLLQRWRLYRSWRAKAEMHYLQELQTKQPEYEEAMARSNELLRREDSFILQNARIIGMTTTCAARYRRTLQQISPKIVLVEEAAEVLEAHIIASLPKDCEHLILIGDHQQLRPNPAVYKLAKKYRLDVSLFERMMNVGIESERLSVQHRMRPEIAALMKHIYKDLQNHESVESYENIKGMKKNMFFVNHSHLEQSCEDSHSHVNMHEATFLVALCRYLLQQGYRSDQITLLTTYTGQMFAMRDCMNDTQNEQVQRVRLTTVDNYQGEENDIILLSLVRSNKNEKVGFIETVNRTCVALSRAKKGFYCIGNLSHLSKYSDIWNKIVADLKTSGSIGDALPLVCQIHHSEVAVEKASDFTGKVTNGGCQRPCEVRLECGHVCRKLCHPLDTDHEEYKCIEPCVKTVRGCSHICPRLCWEGCVSECQEIVERTLPCSHSVKTKCGKKLSSVECTAMCEKTLPICGHRCQALCGKPCTKKCTELVKKLDWPCGHIVTAACCAASTDCQVLCQTVLECGHHCSGRCGECRMGRVHKRCKYKCGRLLVCSHSCRHSCNQPCPPCSRKCENRCKHSKCDKMCGEPCVPCREPCSWTCRHFKCSKLCGEICDRPRCNKPCRKKLRCSHICRGLCGEECICAECEKNDDQPITEIFLGGEDKKDALFIQLPDCKHIFAVVDLDRYMDMSQDEIPGGLLIQLKSCPRCKTPIRQSQRYAKAIKQQLEGIEKVKRKVFGNPRIIEENRRLLLKRLLDLKTAYDGCGSEDIKKLERRVRWMGEGAMTAITENQVMLTERFYSIISHMKKHVVSEQAWDVTQKIRPEGRCVKRELEYMRIRTLSDGVTQRELRDINTEFTRLELILELCVLKYDIHRLRLTFKEDVMRAMNTAQDHLASEKRIEDKMLDSLLKNLAVVRRKYPMLSPITPEERKEIVFAMNTSHGHWYQCPRGHVYSVEGCGGPVQLATCPDCRALIEGRNHMLVEGNTRATDMDDARTLSCRPIHKLLT